LVIDFNTIQTYIKEISVGRIKINFYHESYWQ
jgi:hypothetical protein